MAALLANMPVMARKQNKAGVNKPTPKPTVVVAIRLSPRLFKVLEAHVAGIEPRSSVAAVGELAIRRYLESVGLWPPPPDPG